MKEGADIYPGVRNPQTIIFITPFLPLSFLLIVPILTLPQLPLHFPYVSYQITVTYIRNF